jgi:hypothetical protein
MEAVRATFERKEKGMGRQISLRTYLVSTTIVWLAILVAASVILRGTPYFGQLLPILGGGIVWFVVILPAAFFKA